MVLCHKSNIHLHDYESPAFRTAYEFLAREDHESLPAGRQELENGVVVQVLKYTTKKAEEARFETHDRFFDIQYVVKGHEFMDLIPRERLHSPEPYNAEKDITFYDQPATTEMGRILLKEGELIIVGPEDGHKPSLQVDGPSENMKLVIKVPVK